jgi:methionyl-tRNA formyltransferase
MRCRTAFLGSPAFAVPSLRAVAARHEVAWVLTQPDRPAGRGRKPQPTAVRSAATALGLDVETYERHQRPNIEARLRELDLDVLVVVAFGHILRPSTFGCARRGAVNVHASLLPRWRGVAPIERALWAGDTETGVTLMAIDAAVDTGGIIARRPVPIGARETRISLAEKLALAGAEVLQDELSRYVAGELDAKPQPQRGATYAPRLEKHEGRIDWSRSAADIDLQVRALSGWPGTWTELGSATLKVHGARPHDAASESPPGTVVIADGKRGVHVACGRGRLQLLELQIAGRARLAAEALVRGRQIQVGQRLGTSGGET